MLLYYHSWMFYNHFIATLYHFLGLTWWHSAKCQLLFSACFLHRRKSISNGVQTQRNFLSIFSRPEDTRWAEEVPEGCPEGAQPTRARLGRVQVGYAHLAGLPHRLLLYKYPNIPETLGESTKINSSPRKFQNHQIQSKHHHRGAHHPHWCLFDDV